MCRRKFTDVFIHLHSNELAENRMDFLAIAFDADLKKNIASIYIAFQYDTEEISDEFTL